MTETYEERIEKVLNSRTQSFVSLLKIAGLDPSQDLRGADLSGVSFQGENLAGFDFRGSDLAGCDFSDSLISLAKFDNQIDLEVVGKAKDFHSFSLPGVYNSIPDEDLQRNASLLASELLSNGFLKQAAVIVCVFGQLDKPCASGVRSKLASVKYELVVKLFTLLTEALISSRNPYDNGLTRFPLGRSRCVWFAYRALLGLLESTHRPLSDIQSLRKSMVGAYELPATQSTVACNANNYASLIDHCLKARLFSSSSSDINVRRLRRLLAAIRRDFAKLARKPISDQTGMPDCTDTGSDERLLLDQGENNWMLYKAVDSEVFGLLVPSLRPDTLLNFETMTKNQKRFRKRFADPYFTICSIRLEVTLASDHTHFNANANRLIQTLSAKQALMYESSYRPI